MTPPHTLFPPAPPPSHTHLLIQRHEHAWLHGCSEAVEQVVVLATNGGLDVQAAGQHHQQASQAHT